MGDPPVVVQVQGGPGDHQETGDLEQTADHGEGLVGEHQVHHVADRPAALDPEVVRQMLGGATTRSVLDPLTPREREVLAPMAERWSNRAIARCLVVPSRTVEAHTRGIFTKLDLPESEDEHPRVRAILAYLGAAGAA